MQWIMATMCGIILCMGESPGIARLRKLVAAAKRANAAVDAQVETLLRDGEFVEDIADALEVSRETVRRTRDKLDLPDAREIRRAKGLPTRRS